VRDAVTPADVGGGTLTDSPPPHPISNGIIVSRRLASIAVRRSGIQMTSVTLVRGKKNCCLGKALMCCYREAGMVGLIQFRSTPCVRLGKKKMIGV
jgi:hypothetical protein